jgi:hypothetical protein
VPAELRRSAKSARSTYANRSRAIASPGRGPADSGPARSQEVEWCSSVAAILIVENNKKFPQTTHPPETRILGSFLAASAPLRPVGSDPMWLLRRANRPAHNS